MTPSDIFDYIVIGGGTSGLVVAARLVEDPAIRVCIVEAGGDVSTEPDVLVPGFGFKNIGKPDMDWRFSSAPQTHAGGRPLFLPRGKALGGSSMINLMVLGRGHAAEYNAFETLGSPGWNWQGLVEYFRKSETFAPTPAQVSSLCVAVNPQAHGTEGPVHRSLATRISDIDSPWVGALKELGVPYNPDSFSGDNTGVWGVNRSIDSRAQRSSSASGYYAPVKSRDNLVVITAAHATRILFNSSGDASGLRIATGVEYRKDGRLHTVSASKEVLLCAGAFQTPQLLELSGIGDKNVLTGHGIPVLVDLPGVGSNLQDHFWCPYVAETDLKFESIEVLQDPLRAAEEWKLYEESQTGLLAGTPSTSYAFLPKQYFAKDWEPARVAEPLSTSPQWKMQMDWLNGDTIPVLEMGIFPGFLPVPSHTPEPGKSYCSFFLALTHAFARGTVHIASPDPLAAPSIDPCVLDNALDIDLLVQAIKFSRRLAATADLRTAITHEVLPGAAVESDSDLVAYVRKTVSTVFHPIGTAAMLPRSEGGVVDSALRVYGTANLRVIDASIIPIHLSAHIQATVYAIAEKGVDIVKHGN
ncbi:alcohol oxidase [Mycena rosella]|uniref:Alcohol oxidase n=1 Tax=Mycena rosella TaxID=1033263 RepID=A0AAD7DJ14_MYCRO|nr:alcohol oxidase [Mycena rosella]